MYTIINEQKVDIGIAYGVCHQVMALYYNTEISKKSENRISIGLPYDNFMEAVAVLKRLPNKGLIQTLAKNADGKPSHITAGVHFRKTEGGMNYDDIAGFCNPKPFNPEIDEEIVVNLADGCSLKSGSKNPDSISIEYVRLCDPKGEELVYWDREEWTTDPDLVMGAIINSAAGIRLDLNPIEDDNSPGM